MELEKHISIFSKTEKNQLSSLQPLCADRVENTVSNSDSIVTCVFVAAGTRLPIRCLETAVVYSPISQLLNSNYCTRNINNNNNSEYKIIFVLISLREPG
jgi:hypothetical protein